VAICSTVDPFSNLRVSRDHLRSLGWIQITLNSIIIIIKK
jgi:hypothetical protein